MEWYYFFSDKFIGDTVTMLATEYTMISTAILLPALIWVIQKFTSWTPWTSDDKIHEIIEQKFGIKKG